MARASVVHALWANSMFRYLLVGGICFLADLVLLWFMHAILGFALAIATPIAFLLSFFVTYTAQRMVAFRSAAKVSPSVVRYGLLVGFNTVATTAIVWLINELGFGWMVGKLVAVLVTTVWNYFAYRYWVFSGSPGGGKYV